MDLLITGMGGCGRIWSKQPLTAPASRPGRRLRINLDSPILARIIRVDAIESRLSAVERRVGLAPRISDLDQQIGQARRQRQAAERAGQDERAAALHGREEELLAEKASRQQEWAAAQPDLPSLAKRVRQLSDEIEQLRRLLRPQGTEPEQGTA